MNDLFCADDLNIELPFGPEYSIYIANGCFRFIILAANDCFHISSMTA